MTADRHASGKPSLPEMLGNWCYRKTLPLNDRFNDEISFCRPASDQPAFKVEG
jgi:hypothetical protein